MDRFVLTGVLRNDPESGLNDLPTEASFAMLDSKSSKFAKLHGQLAKDIDMEDVEAFLNDKTHGTVRYIIKKELRWQARDLLDQLNISERIVYPGLDGLSRWLARHYYVK